MMGEEPKESMEPIYISARQAFQNRDLLLLDIRPKEERIGEIGFIPGSLSTPLLSPSDTINTPQDLLSSATGVVLACLSGQRAKLAWRDTIDGKPALVLEGGTLAWGAEGLPLASLHRTHETIDDIDSIPSFVQSLRACFVAEWIESSLSAGLHNIANPVDLVERCLQVEGVSASSASIDALHHVMDRLAWHSLRAGTKHNKIAHNLNVMLTTLQRLNP